MKLRHIPAFAFTAMLMFAACNPGASKNAAGQADNSGEVKEGQKADSAANEFKISFTMAGIDGKQVNVTDEFAKHEITVVDFWASWCGPCRHEMPNLVRTYNTYKDKGLGIVGVSLDEDKEQWTNAVKEMGMAWTQLSDLQGWHNSAAQMYGIQAIPFTIIVDKNGRVLDAGLRGEALETFIANKLGQ